MFHGLSFGMPRSEVRAAAGFEVVEEAGSRLVLGATLDGADAQVIVELGAAPGWEDRLAGLEVRWPDYREDEPLLETPMGAARVAREGAPAKHTTDGRDEKAVWRPDYGKITLTKSWEQPNRKVDPYPVYVLRFWSRGYQRALTEHEARPKRDDAGGGENKESDRGAGRPGAASILGFAIGMSRERWRSALGEGLALTAQAPDFVRGAGDVAGIDARLAWRFDHEDALVELSVSFTGFTAPVPLADTPMYTALAATLGPTTVERVGEGDEIARWRDDDVVVLLGKTTTPERDRFDDTPVAYTVEAWSARFRAAEEARVDASVRASNEEK